MVWLFVIIALIVLTLLVIFINGRMDNIALQRRKTWCASHTEEERKLVEDYRKSVRVSIKDAFKFERKKNK